MAESLQHKLDRVRRPRVQITYDVETNGAMQKTELPFVVGVMADLSAQPKEALRPLKERKFVNIDRDNFNDVLARSAPRLALKVDNKLTGAGDSKLAVELNFKTIEDFDPARVPEQADRNRSYFKQFLEGAVKPGQVVSKDVETNIKYWIGEIDKKLSAQLNEIVHAPEFQRLEGTWRGLHYLVQQSETGESLKLRVLNVTKRELGKDLEKAVEFDQSATFKKVYEDEYGQLGGEPYGMLLADYEFGRHPEDIEML